MRWWSLSLWLCLLLMASSARTQESPQLDETKEACVEAFRQAQRLRDAGELRAARQQLMKCSLAACPKIIVDKCVPWLTRNETELPTIVIVAKDQQGNDTVAVKVRVDGIVVAESLDGRPIAIDPGPHELAFEHRDAAPQKQRLVITQGEKNRRIAVSFVSPEIEPPPPPPLPPPPRPIPKLKTSRISSWVWIGYGVAAAGLVVGGIAGGLALSAGNDLRASCGGSLCTDTPEHRDAYDKGLLLSHTSTAALVIGGVGAAVGSIALLVGDTRIEAGLRSIRATVSF